MLLSPQIAETDRNSIGDSRGGGGGGEVREGAGASDRRNPAGALSALLCWNVSYRIKPRCCFRSWPMGELCVTTESDHVDNIL